MALYVPEDASIDGRPLRHYQAFLNEHARAVNPLSAPQDLVFGINAARLTPEERNGPLLSSLVAGGFAQWDVGGSSRGTGGSLTVTPQGVAISKAQLERRVPLAAADRVFEDFKSRVDKLNMDGIWQVSEVWIYGSYMRREAEVGDIDGVVLAQRTRALGAAYDLHLQRAGLRRKMLFGPKDGEKESELLQYKVRTLFGAEQHELLHGMQLHPRDLELGMACQRIFTAGGGWREEGILDKHPSAPRKSQQVIHALTIDQGSFTSVNESPERARQIERAGRILERAAALHQGQAEANAVLGAKGRRDAEMARD